jgi:hypothetical protein
MAKRKNREFMGWCAPSPSISAQTFAKGGLGRQKPYFQVKKT